MRLLLAATLALSIAGPAMAQNVTVSAGTELADKIDHYGARDVDRLLARLDEQAEAALARSPYAGARLELVVEDAVPNRPTFEQMADQPGLSMESIGIGGAEVSGQLIMPDGARIPVSYRWFETSLAHTFAAATWSDAERAFRRFCQNLEAGRY